MRKKLTIGILAHVDAGKTTLSEALLFLSGRIRTLGRVDHGNTYLDTNAVERERGITVFSKQARFSFGESDFILLDTPGHVDFSPEAERTLSLLDYAILVISAPDGVQNHTRTLWQLLEFYRVPTFIFVNKTDISVKTAEELEEHVCKALSPCCVAFLPTYRKNELDEKLAMVDEYLLECFLADIPISDGDIAELITERKLFPCIFGAALKTEGVEWLLDALERYTLAPSYREGEFGAKVYKISRSSSARLTYMKLTAGTLSARDEITYLTSEGKAVTEKVTQLRLYSGDKFQQVDSVAAGEICAVPGLSATYVGQGLGDEENACKPLLEPVLSYSIRLPPECDPMLYFPKLKEIEEEEPSLHLYWNSELSQIEARLMGDIQIDLLKRTVLERFGIKCELDAGRILYKEKAAGRAIGIGHFEPLRHYAEVQLLIEPQPKGTGLIFDTNLPENALDTNWQRLILFNLYEKKHRGTLIGAELTDTKITLVAGKAHLKHTEGGDFREATLRAVRQGLMKCGCVLLEPYYKFRLELPDGYIGRAMNDLQQRNAEFDIQSADGGSTVISGRAPVSELHGYPRELISYTRGQGTLSCVSDGYEPCHNQSDTVAAAGYDPEA
ncbi:MAG: TetM/TetW/TetO/TetS family tetracycline resistance ribosomal protection protein, partial [Clostridia bacterium]|nr:TetM/TetW/TetO/TetS family tetracycline resistance ribosomal protection protein [Clostridia bacterium]